MANTSAAALLGQVEPRRSRDAWDIAKARFLEELDDKEKATYNEATAENIFYAASNIQREDQRESKTRSLLANLQPLVSAVEDYGKAMDTLANISSLYLAPIWGSIRVVLVIASNHGRFYNRMIDTFGRIGDILPRFRDYQRIFDSEKHQRFTQALSAAYLDIISLCTEFKTLLRNQKKLSVKRIFQPLSPALNAHLEDAVLRFRQHRKTVDKEAELCHMIEEKEARDLVVRNHAAAEARERENKQRALLASLAKVDNEHKHRRMQRIRHEGTGEWFKTSHEFKAWLNCDTPAMMCLYGIPGCGKSVLISSLIDEILAKCDLDPKGKIAFFYCDHADKRTLDPINIFSSLALQVLRTLGELPTGLLGLLENICQDSTTPEIEDISHLLRESMKRIPLAVIILDGLDEVDEDDRKLIFNILKNLVTQAMVKVFVTSREDTTYLTQVPHVALFRLRVGVNVVAGDIDCFVKHAIRDLIRRRELVIGDPALEDEIFEALSQGAKGMFLWVKFQLDDLCRAETDSSIRKVLRNLPRDLDKTYGRLLARIDVAEQREYIKRMFLWIICARRPFEVEELREAIAFTIEDDHFNPSKIPNDLNRLIRACGNLVVVDDENSVQIAHYTVEQYLLTERGCQPSFFRFTREEANFEVGSVCVAYLSFSDFELQLTKHTDNKTSHFAALENVVRTQSTLPPNSQAAKLVGALRRMRGNQDTPTNIEFERYIGGSKPRQPSGTLKRKYRLLSYVADYWLNHNSIAKENRDTSIRSLRHLQLFDNLALEKKFLFDIRPWDSVPFRWEGFPFVLQIGWAISSNHLLLLRVLLRYKAKDGLGIYLEHATKAFMEFVSTRSENAVQSLRNFSGRGTETWPNSEGWECWLFHCILKASDHSSSDVLCLCFSNWRQSELPTQQNWPHLTFVKHFLLDAVFHSNTSTVEVLTSIILTWPMSLRKQFWSITNTSDGPAKGALEMAFLSNSHHLMNLLTSAGWKASVSLKTSLLYGPNLREAFESSNFEMIRCLLKIFGATDSSLSDIKYRLCGPIDRPSANAKALRFAVASVAKEVGSIAPIHYSPPVRSHWIWTVENASFQDHIDIILAAGAKPWPVQVSFLLWEAIVSNRPGRLDILLKNGVRIRRQPHYLTAKHVQAMAGIQAGSLAIFSGEAWISPLCCAIFHKRYRMIESLFTAGASVNEPGSNLGLAPIHFAAISDSVEAFKCLERHGADLEATDLQGRNIMDFLLSARHTFSLYDHLVTYRDSYSQCSWGPHLFP